MGPSSRSFPGKDGLVHVSELAETRVERVEDFVKEGDEITVMVIDVDPAPARSASRAAPPSPAKSRSAIRAARVAPAARWRPARRRLQWWRRWRWLRGGDRGPRPAAPASVATVARAQVVSAAAVIAARARAVPMVATVARAARAHNAQEC